MGKGGWQVLLAVLCIVLGIATFPFGLLIVFGGAAVLAVMEVGASKLARPYRQERAREESRQRLAEKIRLRRERGQSAKAVPPPPAIKVPREGCTKCNGVGIVQGYSGEMSCPSCGD